MTGTKTSPEGQEKNNLIWIGKSQADSYWQCCADRFDITTFETVYDAVADILVHAPAGVCVINAVRAGSELPSLVQTILSRELARSVFIYNFLSDSGRENFPAADDLRVRKIKNAAELAERLSQISAESVPVSASATEAMTESTQETVPQVSPPSPWPTIPPTADREPAVLVGSKLDIEISDETVPEIAEPEISEEKEVLISLPESEDALNLDKLGPKKDRKVSAPVKGDIEISEGDFHLAQLTSDELDALLGFESDSKTKTKEQK
jgi:hypothetical protein